MKYMPKPEAWRNIWVSIVEEHPKSITGFNSSLTADTDEFDVGATGEQQSALKQVKEVELT